MLTYGMRVRVIEGFYKGCEGIIIEQETVYGEPTKKYKVHFGLTVHYTDSPWINKDILVQADAIL